MYYSVENIGPHLMGHVVLKGSAWYSVDWYRCRTQGMTSSNLGSRICVYIYINRYVYMCVYGHTWRDRVYCTSCIVDSR